jgi:hypothetical protein
MASRLRDLATEAEGRCSHYRVWDSMESTLQVSGQIDTSFRGKLVYMNPTHSTHAFLCPHLHTLAYRNDRSVVISSFQLIFACCRVSSRPISSQVCFLNQPSPSSPMTDILKDLRTYSPIGITASSSRTAIQSSPQRHAVLRLLRHPRLSLQFD